MPPEIEKLGRDELLEVVREQYEKNESLQFENDRLKKLIFGAKSERFIPEVAPEQTSFDFGASKEVKKEESAIETITYEREKNSNKSKPSRQPIPAHLERVIHEIQPEEDVTGLVKIGEEITEELEYVPGKLFVNKFVRPKYVKPEGEKTKVLIGKLPERPSCSKCSAPDHLELLMAVEVSRLQQFGATTNIY